MEKESAYYRPCKIMKLSDLCLKRQVAFYNAEYHQKIIRNLL